MIGDSVSIFPDVSSFDSLEQILEFNVIFPSSWSIFGGRGEEERGGGDPPSTSFPDHTEHQTCFVLEL